MDPDIPPSPQPESSQQSNLGSTPQASPEERSVILLEVEERLGKLQAKLADLRELERVEKLPPDEAADQLEEIMELEQRLQEYVEGLVSLPAIFWQAVRWGGLGVLLGVLLGRLSGI